MRRQTPNQAKVSMPCWIERERSGSRDLHRDEEAFLYGCRDAGQVTRILILPVQSGFKMLRPIGNGRKLRFRGSAKKPVPNSRQARKGELAYVEKAR